MYPLRGVVLVG